MPPLIAIVAMAENRVIGRDGKLPWHLPADLAFFKKTTRGHPVIMGRKTFDSLGKPLPARRNIVITRDPAWTFPGVETIPSPNAIAQIVDLENPAFIIGGAEIFRAMIPLIDHWLVTHVKGQHPGDILMPPFEQDFPNQEIILSAPEFEIRKHTR